MRNLLAVPLLVAGLVVNGRTEAQTPITFAVEGRGAFAIPTGEWTDEDGIGNGYGFGANAQVGYGAFAIYAGWENFIFGLDDDGLDEDVDANAHDTGFRAGLMGSFPVADDVMSIFANAGIIYNTLTTRVGDDTGSFEFESDNALGWEAGAGVLVPLGQSLSFTPAVRYRSHPAEFEAFSELGGAETTVGYVVVDVGLRFGL
jgi:hypothetical protein